MPAAVGAVLPAGELTAGADPDLPVLVAVRDAAPHSATSGAGTIQVMLTRTALAGIADQMRKWVVTAARPAP